MNGYRPMVLRTGQAPVPRPPETETVRPLNANPTVNAILGILLQRRDQDLDQLCRAAQKTPSNLAPVLREMQRARMIRGDRAAYSRRVVYNLMPQGGK